MKSFYKCGHGHTSLDNIKYKDLVEWKYSVGLMVLEICYKCWCLKNKS